MATDLSEVKEVLANLCVDSTISKGVLEALKIINEDLANEDDSGVGMKIDSALGRLEDISLDPNLSADVRTRLWNLTSLLEAAQNNK